MDLTSIALQGLTNAEAQLEQAAARIVDAGTGSSDGASFDTVNLSAEMVALMSAKDLYSLNLATLKTAEEVQKSLVDLKA